MNWDVEKDCLSVPVKSMDEYKVTKRQVLKILAGVYDPLGLLLL